MGWLALQVMILLGLLGETAVAHVRHGREDWFFLSAYLGIFSVCSAVVCFVAWLLIYLPVYWCWPRSGEVCGRWTFITVGATSGGLIGLAFWASVPDRSLVQACISVLLPMSVGVVGAWVGWLREEKERRFLEWQKQVTNPIVE